MKKNGNLQNQQISLPLCSGIFYPRKPGKKKKSPTGASHKLGGEGFPGCSSQGSEQDEKGRRVELEWQMQTSEHTAAGMLLWTSVLGHSPASAGQKQQKQQKSPILVNVGLRKVGVGKTEAACSTAWVSHCLLLQGRHPNRINTSMTKEDRSPVLITSASQALLWDCFELAHRSAAVQVESCWCFRRVFVGIWELNMCVAGVGGSACARACLLFPSSWKSGPLLK